MVLLKNDGILPLTNAPKTIAVIGPLADNKRVLEGNYNGTPSRATSALEGIKKQFASSEVTFTPCTRFLRAAKPVPAALFTTPDGQPACKPNISEQVIVRPTVSAPTRTLNLFYRVAHSWIFQRAFADNFSARWTGFFTPTESGISAVCAPTTVSALDRRQAPWWKTGQPTASARRPQT
jgi:beta-glucosidase